MGGALPAPRPEHCCTPGSQESAPSAQWARDWAPGMAQLTLVCVLSLQLSAPPPSRGENMSMAMSPFPSHTSRANLPAASCRRGPNLCSFFPYVSGLGKVYGIYKETESQITF